MLTITVFYKDHKWRVKRSDKEMATFTDNTFEMACDVALKWAVWDNGRLIVLAKDGIGVGAIDCFRIDVDGSRESNPQPIGEVSELGTFVLSDDPDQIKLDLEVEENGGWYCPNCKQSLLPECVTFEERCTFCGSGVVFISNDLEVTDE